MSTRKIERRVDRLESRIAFVGRVLREVGFKVDWQAPTKNDLVTEQLETEVVELRAWKASALDLFNHSDELCSILVDVTALPVGSSVIREAIKAARKLVEGYRPATAKDGAEPMDGQETVLCSKCEEPVPQADLDDGLSDCLSCETMSLGEYRKRHSGDPVRQVDFEGIQGKQFKDNDGVWLKLRSSGLRPLRTGEAELYELREKVAKLEQENKELDIRLRAEARCP